MNNKLPNGEEAELSNPAETKHRIIFWGEKNLRISLKYEFIGKNYYSHFDIEEGWGQGSMGSNALLGSLI